MARSVRPGYGLLGMVAAVVVLYIVAYNLGLVSEEALRCSGEAPPTPRSAARTIRGGYQRPTGLRLPFHPRSDRPYYSRLIVASWDSVAPGNGSLWQIDQAPRRSLSAPPDGDDYWTLQPRLTWIVPHEGVWYLHLASVGLDGRVSHVRHRRIEIAGRPPDVVCTTHPDPCVRYRAADVSFAWQETGIDTLYVLTDREPDTVPTRKTATAIGARRFRVQDRANGTHFVHIRGADYAGVLGPIEHFQVNIGRESTLAPPDAPRVNICGIAPVPSAGGGEDRLERHEKPSVAVLGLGAEDVVERDAQTLSDSLRRALVTTDLAAVYERDRVGRILDEHGIHRGGCTTDECARRAGQLVGVHYVVTGAVQRLRGTYIVSARLVDVGTGRVVRAYASPGVSGPEALLPHLRAAAWVLLSE